MQYGLRPSIRAAEAAALLGVNGLCVVRPVVIRGPAGSARAGRSCRGWPSGRPGRARTPRSRRAPARCPGRAGSDGPQRAVVVIEHRRDVGAEVVEGGCVCTPGGTGWGWAMQTWEGRHESDRADGVVGREGHVVSLGHGRDAPQFADAAGPRDVGHYVVGEPALEGRARSRTGRRASRPPTPARSPPAGTARGQRSSRAAPAPRTRRGRTARAPVRPLTALPTSNLAWASTHQLVVRADGVPDGLDPLDGRGRSFRAVSHSSSEAP